MLNPSDIPANVTPALSTDGAEGVPVAPKWYVGFVASRAEKAVRDQLLAAGVEAYAATHSEIHIWRRNERKVVERVLITNVVFIRAQKRELIYILKNFPVTAFMIDRAKKVEDYKPSYAIVTDAEMQLLQSILRQQDYEVAFATSGFSLGDHVRVLGFDAHDQLAQIVRIPGDDSTYVGIRFQNLGCAYMKVPITSLIKVRL